MTEKQIRKLAGKWRDRLQLGGWSITLDCEDAKELSGLDGLEGHAEIDACHRMADIQIATRYAPEELDDLLRHEYLHIAMGPLAGFAEMLARQLSADGRDIALAQLDALEHEAMTHIERAMASLQEEPAS